MKVEIRVAVALWVLLDQSGYINLPLLRVLAICGAAKQTA